MKSLVQSAMDIYRYKKFIVLCGTCAAFAGFYTPHSEAVITVHDVQNTLETAKNYAETVKLVTNTAQQIAYLAKEIVSLPQETLNRLRNEADQSFGNIGSAMRTVGGMLGKDGQILVDASDPKKYFGNLFPSADQIIIHGINGNVTMPVTKTMQDNLEQSGNEAMSKMNMQGAKGLSMLAQQLQKAQNRLLKLQELNASPEGQKQAQQIANEISVVQSQIQSINGNIAAIQAQAKILQMQKESQEKQNQIQVNQANAAAEKEAIKKIHEEAKAAPAMGLMGL